MVKQYKLKRYIEPVEMDLVKINFMNYVIIKEKQFVLLKVSLVRFLEDIVMCNGIIKEKTLLSL